MPGACMTSEEYIDFIEWSIIAAKTITEPSTYGLTNEDMGNLITQHFNFIVHSAACEEQFCNLPGCSMTKSILNHMRICVLGYNCSSLFCAFYQYIFDHTQMCQKEICFHCELWRLKINPDILPPSQVIMKLFKLLSIDF